MTQLEELTSLVYRGAWLVRHVREINKLVAECEAAGRLPLDDHFATYRMRCAHELLGCAETLRRLSSTLPTREAIARAAATAGMWTRTACVEHDN